MIKFCFHIILFLWLLIGSVAGQTNSLDSLIGNLRTMPDDTLKVSALLTISGNLRAINAKQAVEYAKKSLSLSQKLNHNRSKIKSYYMIAAGFITGGQSDSCVFYAKKAENLAEKSREISLLGNIYNLIGAGYRSLSDIKNAIKYGYKSVKLLEQIQDSTSLSYAYNNLGNLYWDKNDSLNARKYYIKALDILEDRKDSINLPNTYSNLYLVSGDSIRLDFLMKAKEIAIKTGNISDLAYIYTNLGSYYFNDSIDYSKALQYYRKGLIYARKVGDIYSMGQLYSNIGDLMNRTGKKDSSIIYIKKALNYSNEIFDAREIQDEYFTLYELFRSLNNSDSALHYLEKYNIIKDSLYNQDILAQIEDANAKYETEKKEAEIAKHKLKIALDKKKKNQIIFGALLLLMILTLIYQWYIFKQKRKNKEIELALKLQEIESKKLKELNEAKSGFFANITHEFKTPLTLIAGPLQDAIGRVKGSKTVEILRIAHSNAQKLLNLVNEILNLATLEEGTPQLQNSNLYLNKLLKRIFYSYQSFARIRQINMKMEFHPEQDVCISIDQQKLEKIIDNLLSNAFKYTNEGGTVTLSSEIRGDKIYISVADTGTGIDKKDLKNIFNRYYKGINSNDVEGTGIGLAFADQLAKLMNGKIEVKSKKNKGSTFTLIIPADKIENCPEKSKADEEIEVKQVTGSTGYKMKTVFDDKPHILLVDDNKEMIDYLKNILEDYFNIDIAYNGFEALEKLKNNNNYDLVSSDVMMPKMDGFVFRMKMNEHPEWSNIPFILLTARSLKEDKLKGFKLGIDDYITKPFNTTEYIARITNLIKNKKEREKWMSGKAEDSPDFIHDKTIDDELISNMEKIVLKYIDDPDFNVAVLAKEMGYSQRNLSRITRKLIGITPVNLILEIRLQKAYHLLKTHKFKNISEVRYEVGIEHASYFTRKFVQRFGVKPGEIGLTS